jgi:hypothetical protein
MKKIITTCISIVTIGLTTTRFAQAQTLKDFRGMPAEQKAHLVTDSIKAILVLTDEQYNKTYAVILDAVTKASAVIKGDDSRVAKGKKLRSLLADEEAKINPILTQAQFAKYQTKKQNIIAYYRQRLQDEKLVFNVPE